MKNRHLFLLFILLFTVLLLYVPSIQSQTQQVTHFIQIDQLITDTQQSHIYLDPNQTITYIAPLQVNNATYTSTDVQLDATNQTFLTQIETDLYIKAYDYFGSTGAWTNNQNFTLTNPTSTAQEVFLKISQNYIQTTYAPDIVNGDLHTIEFTSQIEANRIFVRWQVFAALTYLEVNGTQIDFTTIPATPNSVQVEFLPTYLSFQTPPNRIQPTHFRLQIQQENGPSPTGYCYISAIKLDHQEVTLQPNQQILFTPPQLDNWVFVTAAAYTNLTATLYSDPYPFKLINLSIWDANDNPLLVTALDTVFGIQNQSNQTYNLYLDIVYYYWQNQTSLTFTHQIIKTDNVIITHQVTATVTDQNVGGDLSLTGQYLRFQVPGKTVIFNAPDPTGKYEQTYIPLRQGNYTLITEENRINTTINAQLNDLQLTNTLHIHVNYNSEPYANAQVTVTQNNKTHYTATTNQNGDATLIIHSNVPETNQLDITVTKDTNNYTTQTVTYFVGVTYIGLIAVLTLSAITVTAFLIYRHKKCATHNP